MIIDILLFYIVKLLERFAKKYNFSEKLLGLSQIIIMVGVSCIVMRNYVSAAEIIYFGVRTHWSALTLTR